ncbi:MAG TPA: DUF1800 domain-containing protein [Vicinamibacterales bacterium]
MNSSLRALNGFGLGARPGESGRLRDPKGWLRAQLSGGPPTLAAPPDATFEAIAAALRSFRAVAQQATDEQRRQARQEARRRLIAIAAAEGDAALTARVTTDRPFIERLVAFWSNHLCVSTGAKILVAPLAGSYEREAIRPHVLGRFADMVLASARHPAMLVYLDNFQSIGPLSSAARAGNRRGQPRGLNENYARELLELHTLGVDGGYSQQDVQELAKILTGWTVSGINRPGLGGRNRRGVAATDDDRVGFEFQEVLHEPGAKTVLGARYDGAGVTEGERVIRALCDHPSTARLVARKLVTHFVNDTPPPAAVDRIAGVFRNTHGDLRAVSEALIDLPDAWREPARKFRTPQDWLVAVLRAFNATDVAAALMPILRQLRQPLWSPAAPKGFDDGTAEWADPDSLLNRAELARTISRRLRLERTDPAALLDVIDIGAGDQLHKFVSDSSIPADERVALVLAGPAFQWR